MLCGVRVTVSDQHLISPVPRYRVVPTIVICSNYGSFPKPDLWILLSNWSGDKVSRPCPQTRRQAYVAWYHICRSSSLYWWEASSTHCNQRSIEFRLSVEWYSCAWDWKTWVKLKTRSCWRQKPLLYCFWLLTPDSQSSENFSQRSIVSKKHSEVERVSKSYHTGVIENHTSVIEKPVVLRMRYFRAHNLLNVISGWMITRCTKSPEWYMVHQMSAV